MRSRQGRSLVGTPRIIWRKGVRVGDDRKKDPWMSPDLAMLGKLETLGQALDGSLT